MSTHVSESPMYRRTSPVASGSECRSLVLAEHCLNDGPYTPIVALSGSPMILHDTHVSILNETGLAAASHFSLTHVSRCMMCTNAHNHIAHGEAASLQRLLAYS